MVDFISAADFEKKMRDIEVENIKTGDRELYHKQADELLCKTLKSLGYDKGIEIYKRIGKNYA